MIGNFIHLLTDFETKTWLSIDGTVEGMIIHELGHVFDNNFGGRLSSLLGGGTIDALMNYLGLRTNSIFRFTGGIDFTRTKRTQQWPINNPNLNYGNNSAADYFAHTFAASILEPWLAPLKSEIWMVSLIDLTK